MSRLIIHWIRCTPFEKLSEILICQWQIAKLNTLSRKVQSSGCFAWCNDREDHVKVLWAFILTPPRIWKRPVGRQRHTWNRVVETDPHPLKFRGQTDSLETRPWLARLVEWRGLALTNAWNEGCINVNLEVHAYCFVFVPAQVVVYMYHSL